MSIDAIRWAFQQPVKPASAKFVLVTIADRAGEDHCAYPSIRRIVFDTGLNRKTVLQAVQLLMKVGLLERTGEMRGATDSVPVYRLIGVPDRSNPEIGTGPESGTGKQYRNSPEAVSLFPSSGPNISAKQSQNRDTEPTKEPPREPTNEPKRRNGTSSVVPIDQLPEWVDKEAWQDFRTHRKEVRKPLTPLAEQKALAKLHGFVDDGFEQREVIDHVISNGWLGLFPPQPPGRPVKADSRHPSDRMIRDPLA